MDLECDCARELVALARRAIQGDNVDNGMLCRAAIRVIDNPPRDEILRDLADHVVQAVLDWSRFGGSRARLAGVLEGYRMAADAIGVDERLHH
jgi:hypothetical protein